MDELTEQARAALLRKIAEAAAETIHPPHLRDLAEAYQRVTGQGMPAPTPSPIGGVEPRGASMW